MTDEYIGYDFDIDNMDDIQYDAVRNLTDEDIEAIRQYKLDTMDLGYD